MQTALAYVEPGDTVGSFCSRYGMSRETFFDINPGPMIDVDGVSSRVLFEGDILNIDARAVANAEEASLHMQGVSDTSPGEAAAGIGAGVAFGIVLLIGIALTLGYYYILYRGAKALLTST